MGKKPLNTMRLAIISKKGENFHLFDANPKRNAIKLISIIEFRNADIATLKRKMLFASLSKRLVGGMCVDVSCDALPQSHILVASSSFVHSTELIAMAMAIILKTDSSTSFAFVVFGISLKSQENRK